MNYFGKKLLENCFIKVKLYLLLIISSYINFKENGIYLRYWTALVIWLSNTIPDSPEFGYA